MRVVRKVLGRTIGEKRASGELRTGARRVYWASQLLACAALMWLASMAPTEVQAQPETSKLKLEDATCESVEECWSVSTFSIPRPRLVCTDWGWRGDEEAPMLVVADARGLKLRHHQNSATIGRYEVYAFSAGIGDGSRLFRSISRSAQKRRGLRYLRNARQDDPFELKRIGMLSDTDPHYYARFAFPTFQYTLIHPRLGYNEEQKMLCYRPKSATFSILARMPLVRTKPEVPYCTDACGDGVCAMIVCKAIGCPCGESARSCPSDCALSAR
jgi:hypothetical protein